MCTCSGLSLGNLTSRKTAAGVDLRTEGCRVFSILEEANISFSKVVQAAHDHKEIGFTFTKQILVE